MIRLNRNLNIVSSVAAANEDVDEAKLACRWTMVMLFLRHRLSGDQQEVLMLEAAHTFLPCL